MEKKEDPSSFNVPVILQSEGLVKVCTNLKIFLVFMAFTKTKTHTHTHIYINLFTTLVFLSN